MRFFTARGACIPHLLSGFLTTAGLPSSMSLLRAFFSLAAAFRSDYLAASYLARRAPSPCESKDSMRVLLRAGFYKLKRKGRKTLLSRNPLRFLNNFLYVLNPSRAMSVWEALSSLRRILIHVKNRWVRISRLRIHKNYNLLSL